MVFMPLLKALILLSAYHAVSVDSAGPSATPANQTVKRRFTSPGGRHYKELGSGTIVALTAETVRNWTPAKLIDAAIQNRVNANTLINLVQWTKPDGPDLYNYQEHRTPRRFYKWDHLPAKRGIYRYKDRRNNKVVYIGKAKNIKTRTASHINGKKQFCDKQFMKDPANKRSSHPDHATVNSLPDFDSWYFIEFITEEDFRAVWIDFLMKNDIPEQVAKDRVANYEYHYMEAWALWVHMRCSTGNPMPAFNRKRDWKPYALRTHLRHEEEHHTDLLSGVDVRQYRLYEGNPDDLVEIAAEIKDEFGPDEEVEVEDGYENSNANYRRGNQMFNEELALEQEIEQRMEEWAKNEDALESRAGAKRSLGKNRVGAKRAFQETTSFLTHMADMLRQTRNLPSKSLKFKTPDTDTRKRPRKRRRIEPPQSAEPSSPSS